MSEHFPLENSTLLPDGGASGRCPVCALNGGDRKGNHLRVYPDGKVHCIVNEEHWREARRLLGLTEGLTTRAQFTPEQKRQWAIRKAREKAVQAEKKHLLTTIEESLTVLVERWIWDEADMWDDSPLRLDGPHCDDPRMFIELTFAPGDIVWTGQEWQSGNYGDSRFRSAADWQMADWEEVGPLFAASTWKPGIVSRSAPNVETAKYLVLDFDGRKGWRPKDQDDLERHLVESRAIIRWLREGMDWRLKWIVWTGSKSLHAGFHDPGQDCVESLKVAAEGFGIDTSLIGHPEHPARLPGGVHPKTGRKSTLVWMGLDPIA